MIEQTKENLVKAKMFTKTDKIKGLIPDAEVPDEYREENIKQSNLFNDMIEENKKIVDDAFAILKTSMKAQKEYLADKKGCCKKVADMQAELDNDLKNIPLEIRDLFGLN
jgi:hypothetical protein